MRVNQQLEELEHKKVEELERVAARQGEARDIILRVRRKSNFSKEIASRDAELEVKERVLIKSQRHSSQAMQRMAGDLLLSKQTQPFICRTIV